MREANSRMHHLDCARPESTEDRGNQSDYTRQLRSVGFTDATPNEAKDVTRPDHSTNGNPLGIEMMP